MVFVFLEQFICIQFSVFCYIYKCIKKSIFLFLNNRYLYFLTPTKGVNELRIQTYNCGYKILVCINVVEYGSESLKRKAMYPGMPIMGSAMHPGQSSGVMMYRSVHR